MPSAQRSAQKVAYSGS